MIDSGVHQEIQHFFLSLVKRDQLHHAYGFVGPKQVGKKRVALSLAAEILNTSVEKLFLHPDFLLIEQEMNEKTGKTKRDIDIEQIKNLREFSQSRPFQATKKVVIIAEAEKMNDHSSNALLKTLEEPKGDTIFFLLTEDENELLATIRSRLQVVYFYPQTQEKIISFLQQNGVEGKEKISSIARLSRGLPELGLEISQTSGEYEQEVQRFTSLFGEPLFQKLKAVEELFGDKKDSVAAREEWQNILDCWEVVNRDMLLGNIAAEKFSIHKISIQKKYSKRIFIEIHNKITEAKKYLQNNIHPRLLIEQILLSIP